MSNDAHAAAVSISLCGGPLHRLEQHLRLSREGVPADLTRSALFIVVALVPLIALAAIQGVLFGPRVTLPLWMDWTVYARFLIGIPLFVFAERVIDQRISLAFEGTIASGVIEGQALADFKAAHRKLDKSLDSLIPEILLLIGSFTLAWVNSHHLLGLHVSSWREADSGTTLAGHWHDLVSLPIVTFLMARWLWRILLWTIFLARIARSDLHLVPIHPDGAAGLGLIGGAHTAFGAILVPISAIVAARAVQWIQYGGGTLGSLQNSYATLALGAVLLTLGPTLVFMPKMVLVKRLGLVAYGKLAATYTREFDDKWVRGGAKESDELLGSADIQSLADLSNSVTIVRNMRLVPAALRHAAVVVISAVLPTIPFVMAIVPLQKIVKELGQIVMR